MSTLSNVPYEKILDYWSDRLASSRYREEFIATKALEIRAFKTGARGDGKIYSFTEFPQVIPNTIPDNPNICVVIPAFFGNENDLSNLSNLVSSIQKQTVRPNNVIVVDDCSTEKYNLPDEFITEQLKKNSGPATARNKGKEIAESLHADVVAFTDTDCILSDNWIETIIYSFNKNRDCNIISGNTIAYGNYWLGTYHDINGTLNGRRFKTTPYLLYGPTANLAITANVNSTIHFNESYPIAAGEDIEFCFHANRKGFKIKYIPTMVVKHNYGYSHNNQENIKKFKWQFAKYGQGEKILLKHIPDYYVYLSETEEIPAINYQR
jgi:glycosyltransferase involved in cell wall biosynthesis